MLTVLIINTVLKLLKCVKFLMYNPFFFHIIFNFETIIKVTA